MSHRRERVAEQLRDEISRLLQRGLRDPRLGFVTVTEVRLSGDLRSARVYVSVLGEEEERRASLEALEAAHGYLRGRIGRNLRLRYVPDLHFTLDLTPQQGSRIEEILQDIASQRPADGGEE